MLKHKLLSLSLAEEYGSLLEKEGIDIDRLTFKIAQEGEKVKWDMALYLGSTLLAGWTFGENNNDTYRVYESKIAHLGKRPSKLKEVLLKILPKVEYVKLDGLKLEEQCATVPTILADIDGNVLSVLSVVIGEFGIDDQPATEHDTIH